MAQTKQPKPETPESDDAQATGNIQDADTAGGNNTQPPRPPAPTPGDTADVHATDKPKTRANGSAKTGNGQNRDDHEPVRRDHQIAQGRRDDDRDYGRQPPRDDDYDRPSARRSDEQRSLFGEPDDTYYDRRPHPQNRDEPRDDNYDRGRRAAQGYGHTSARDNDERLSREYGSDYRRYSDAGYDNRSRAFDQGPYADRDRYYSEGGQYRPRPQGYRPNDNGRDFEREAREQPRNGWRESNADPRYDDAYDHHRNRAWSSQGNQDRHRDWDRDDQGRYNNDRYRDDDRYRSQDRGYGDRPGNYPATRADDRGYPDRWRDERGDYRETRADDRYEYDNGPRRRR